MGGNDKSEIFHLYIDFLSVCLKTYDFASDIIDKEVLKFTKNELKDGWLFFLLMFSHSCDLSKAKDLDSLNEYLHDIGQENMRLTEKGQALFSFLEQKIQLHANVLRFNGISLYDLISNINSMTKMMSFWKVVLKK